MCRDVLLPLLQGDDIPRLHLLCGCGSNTEDEQHHYPNDASHDAFLQSPREAVTLPAAMCHSAYTPGAPVMSLSGTPARYGDTPPGPDWPTTPQATVLRPYSSWAPSSLWRSLRRSHALGTHRIALRAWIQNGAFFGAQDAVSKELFGIVPVYADGEHLVLCSVMDCDTRRSVAGKHRDCPARSGGIDEEKVAPTVGAAYTHNGVPLSNDGIDSIQPAGDPYCSARCWCALAQCRSGDLGLDQPGLHWQHHAHACGR
jgi:hypothetical protein